MPAPTKTQKAIGVAVLGLVLILILIFWLHDKVPPFFAASPGTTSPLPVVTMPAITIPAGAYDVTLPPGVYLPTGPGQPQIFGNPTGQNGDHYDAYGLNPQNNETPGICGCGFG